MHVLMKPYHSDDPLNRTAADNAEWLLRFKRAMGIMPASENPNGTSNGWIDNTMDVQSTDQWNDVSTGVFDATSTSIYPPVSAPQASNMGNMVDFTVPREAANTPTLSASGVVFASKDFEDKLVQFSVAEVASSGRMPPDEAIQAKAKEISGLEVWQAELTPADDPTLLNGFKQLVIDKVKAVLGAHDDRPAQPFPHYQHTQPQQAQPHSASLLSPSVPTADRGMDAIDPGLLPALDPNTINVAETRMSPPTPVVHVAISEKRLEEIIGEMGRGGG